MNFLLLFFFFMIGLIFGSFFHVVGDRLPQTRSFVQGRSHCPHCHQQLSWYELIPLVSYIMQKGTCRNCKRRISFMYPFVELITGILFALSYHKFSMDGELLMALLLSSLLMITFTTDVKYMMIPNQILLVFLPLFIVIRFWQPLDPWWSPLAGAVVIFILLTLIILMSKGGMGGGDLKLFVLLGIILGLEKVLLAFLLACLFGALFGVMFMALGKLQKNKPMPFVPYIALGALFAYFYGEQWVRWYINIF